MPIGAIEAGALIGSSTLLTIVIAKIKCYYKHGAQFPCSIGFTDYNLADNDDIHVATTKVNDIELLYVGKRKTHSDDGYDSENNAHRFECPNNFKYG